MFKEEYLDRVDKINLFIQKNLSRKKEAILVQISKVSFLNLEKIARETKLIKTSKKVASMSK